MSKLDYITGYFQTFFTAIEKEISRGCGLEHLEFSGVKRKVDGSGRLHVL